MEPWPVWGGTFSAAAAKAAATVTKPAFAGSRVGADRPCSSCGGKCVAYYAPTVAVASGEEPGGG